MVDQVLLDVIIKGMRQRVSGILIKENKILLIHRIKPDKDYYVLPGGGIEPDETLEEALIREMKEETSLEISKFSKIWEAEIDFEGSVQLEHYFLIENFSGTPKLGGPEQNRQTSENIYEFVWAPVKDIQKLEAQPKSVKNNIFDEIKKLQT